MSFNIDKPIETTLDCLNFIEWMKNAVIQLPDGHPIRETIKRGIISIRQDNKEFLETIL